VLRPMTPASASAVRQAWLARPSMSLLGVPAVASACRRPMRVCNRSAGYPLRSAKWNWCSAALDVVLTSLRVALPAVRNRVSGCSNYMVDLGGATRARTADLLHAIRGQHVHPRIRVQVAVLPRPCKSARVRVSCCTSVLYRCHPCRRAPPSGSPHPAPPRSRGNTASSPRNRHANPRTTHQLPLLAE
jgi:hypothetical protein